MRPNTVTEGVVLHAAGLYLFLSAHESLRSDGKSIGAILDYHFFFGPRSSVVEFVEAVAQHADRELLRAPLGAPRKRDIDNRVQRTPKQI